MAERSLLVCLVALVACSQPRTHVHRVLSFPYNNPPATLSADKIQLPEGVAVVVHRSEGAPVDYSVPPVSGDPTIASIRATMDFDSFLVTGLKPGSTTLHFADGESTDLSLVVTAQP